MLTARLATFKMETEDDFDATRWLDRTLIRLSSRCVHELRWCCSKLALRCIARNARECSLRHEILRTAAREGASRPIFRAALLSSCCTPLECLVGRCVKLKRTFGYQVRGVPEGRPADVPAGAGDELLPAVHVQPAPLPVCSGPGLDGVYSPCGSSLCSSMSHTMLVPPGL